MHKWALKSNKKLGILKNSQLLFHLYCQEYSSERRAWFSLVQDILLQKVPEHPIPDIFKVMRWFNFPHFVVGLDVELAYSLGIGESYDSWQNESINTNKTKKEKVCISNFHPWLKIQAYIWTSRQQINLTCDIQIKVSEIWGNIRVIVSALLGAAPVAYMARVKGKRSEPG